MCLALSVVIRVRAILGAAKRAPEPIERSSADPLFYFYSLFECPEIGEILEGLQ